LEIEQEAMVLATRLETLKTRLDEYIKCEAAIIGGTQSYKIGTRSLTRANLKDIADMIKYLENEIARESSAEADRGRNAMIGIIPYDI
jgi:hypothetical protein